MVFLLGRMKQNYHEPVAEAREILQRANALNFEFPLYHVHSRLTLTAIGKMDGDVERQEPSAHTHTHGAQIQLPW